MGWDSETASKLAREIENRGAVLERSLHTHSWLGFGSAKEVMVVNRGCRQGCRFGGEIVRLGVCRGLGRGFGDLDG